MPYRHSMKPVICISIFILAELLPANFVFGAEPLAEPASIVINEIAWMGSKVDGIESKNWWRYEWIELYNNTEQKIYLDGWKIELYKDKLDYTIDLSESIKPKNYFLIVSSDKIADYNLNYSNLTGKFVNKGQKILLKNPQGKIMDEINCLSGWFSGDNKTKQTMERIDVALSGNNASNWQTSQNPAGTPKSKNSAGAQTENITEPEKPASEPETESEKPKNIENIQKIKTIEKAGQDPFLTQTGGGPTSPRYPISSILIASITALFSGAIIFFLKNKLK